MMKKQINNGDAADQIDFKSSLTSFLLFPRKIVGHPFRLCALSGHLLAHSRFYSSEAIAAPIAVANSDICGTTKFRLYNAEKSL